MADAFVAAYRPYVHAVLGEPADRVSDAIADGETWLAAAMADWSSLPAGEQRSSPLEMFREALAFPTAAALEAGTQPVGRDGVAAAALPGDHLDVAPMTSRDLGEEAWKAHVAWGIARAEAVAGVVPRTSSPAGATAALVGNELMDRTRIQSAAADAGHVLHVWRNPGAVESGLARGAPAVVFLDLTHPLSSEILRTLAAAGVRVVAFGPHVDDHSLAAARAAGAAEVLPRSKFFRRLPALFPAPM